MNWKRFCFIPLGIEIGLLGGCTSPPPVARTPYPDSIIVTAPGANTWTEIKSPATTNAASGIATPLQDYDKVVIDTINDKWNKRLDTLAADKIPPSGQVVVKFRLHSNGTVSNLGTVYDKINARRDEISQQVIQDCAPFDPWPPAMVKLVGRDYREMTFTFRYQ